MTYFREFRRRKVFQVGVVYAAAGWVVVQVASQFGPALDIPDFVLSAFALFVILGFPIALVLAWAFELTPDGIRRTAAEAEAGPRAAHPGGLMALPWVVAAAALLALATIVWLRPAPDPPVATPARARFVVEKPEQYQWVTSWESHEIALAPDSTKLVVVLGAADQPSQLWWRHLDETELAPLPGTRGGYSPFFAPDSERIGFFTGRELKIYDFRSGAVDTIASFGFAVTGSWGSDDTLLVADFDFGSEPDYDLFRVSLADGEPERLLPAEGVVAHSVRGWPQFLPNSRRFVYLGIQDEGGYRLFGGDLDEGLTGPLMEFSSRVASTGEYLVYSQNETLFARRFDAATMRFVGEAERLAGGVGLNLTGGSAFAAAADARTVAYQSREEMADEIVWYDRAGTRLESVAEPGRYRSLALAPDEIRLAIELSADRGQDLSIIDLSSGRRQPVTDAPGQKSDPLWSPFGDALVYSGHGGDIREWGLRIVDLGSRAVERLPTQQCAAELPTEWNAELNLLVYSRISDLSCDDDEDSDANEDIYIMEMLNEGFPRLRLGTRAHESGGVISSDGDWLAYVRNENGRSEVYLTTTFGNAIGIPVSIAGGTSPRWRGDGRELYFLSPQEEVMSVRLTPNGENLIPDTPGRLFSIPRGSVIGDYDVTADGERFVVLQGPEPTMQVLMNW